MSSSETKAPVALTIAGLDPSGGAGVLADVRTFATFGCFPTAVITSLTFQNTTGVFGVENQTAEVVRRQTLPIISDFSVAGAKTGMLPTSEVIAEVARLFREFALPAPVVDPVMQATSGDSLIDDEAVETLVRDLFPLARLVTPNIPEAERLSGLKIRNQEGMAEAARVICDLGARAVLIKGGHAQESWDLSNQDSLEAVDLLDDEGKVTLVREPLVAGGEVHGSGCTLSAGIAANLAQGKTLEESVRIAKSFVTELIRSSPQLGHGAKPLFKFS
jgi:hydroxymethylpyrimidine kinase/phosphomethylpyrimidine kinase